MVKVPKGRKLHYARLGLGLELRLGSGIGLGLKFGELKFGELKFGELKFGELDWNQHFLHHMITMLGKLKNAALRCFLRPVSVSVSKCISFLPPYSTPQIHVRGPRGVTSRGPLTLPLGSGIRRGK